MTSPATRQKGAIALGEFIETLIGKLVRVSQAISWRPGTDFERHSTVHVRFSFQVKNTTWAMSGGHFMLYGEDDSLYSVGTTKLQHLELTDSRATITALYDSGAERQSIIEVLTRMPNTAINADSEKRRSFVAPLFTAGYGER